MKGKSNDAVGFFGYLTITKLRDGVEVWKSEPLKNKVVTSTGYGRNLIARALAGDATYPITIDSAAIGDSTTAAADGDTALISSLVSSIPITNLTVSNNVLTVDVFVSDDNLPDDTYAEFGLFANSRMMTRIIISPSYTKGAGEDTLFTWTLTISG